VCCFAALFVLEISGGSWREGCARIKSAWSCPVAMNDGDMAGSERVMLETKQEIRS